MSHKFNPPFLRYVPIISFLYRAFNDVFSDSLSPVTATAPAMKEYKPRGYS